MNEQEIWQALAHRLQEVYPYLFIGANTYYNNLPYIMIETNNKFLLSSKFRLMLTTCNGLWFPRCTRQQIDLNDPDLLDHIKETIQKWLQERNDP